MPINRTRNKGVTLRMTAEELKEFRAKFEKSQEDNQTDFIMALLRNKPIVVNNELVPVLAELKRQGNNLNQIARRLHEGTVVEEEAGQVLRECYAAYKKLLAIELGE